MVSTNWERGYGFEPRRWVPVRFLSLSPPVTDAPEQIIVVRDWVLILLNALFLVLAMRRCGVRSTAAFTVCPSKNGQIDELSNQ